MGGVFCIRPPLSGPDGSAYWFRSAVFGAEDIVFDSFLHFSGRFLPFLSTLFRTFATCFKGASSIGDVSEKYD
jgi:hypothetical protein